MGFLSEGKTLTWEEAKKYADFIRHHGILQFLAVWNREKRRCNDRFTWGDEIEYILVKLDPEHKKTVLCLRGNDILNILEKEEHDNPKAADLALWRPEYGSFMIEGTPGQPYSTEISQYLVVEKNMYLRKKMVERFLHPDERALTIPVYPVMGVGTFTEPPFPPSTNGDVSKSLFLPDQVLNPHRRFATLTANIRLRKERKVAINLPLFKDKNTQPIPPIEDGALPDHIYMDAMGFGMGCCCLQCTYQCCNINEARGFYDQLAVLSPIMLALTAASPIFRGLLADTDVRWNTIVGSVDDRHAEELGQKPLDKFKFPNINKSRYDSIDCYIATPECCSHYKPKYNDLDLVYDKEITKQLMDAGVDEQLSRHLGHLFIRDPLVIYEHKIEIDNEKHLDHFENIQSTNWQTVRFKPPPPGSTIGWRVEFRPMEVQLTDFENASLVIFIALLLRVISTFDLNFYIPITKVDENMKTAHKRDAVLNDKFYWRKYVSGDKDRQNDDYELMTINEIMNGKKENDFIGLAGYIRTYLDTMNLSSEIRERFERYISLVQKRASGELMTTAAWTREFVRSHPAYKHDSVVSHEINHDLLEATHRISTGELQVPKLLADFTKEKPHYPDLASLITPTPTTTPAHAAKDTHK